MNDPSDLDFNANRAERMLRFLQPYADEQGVSLETALADTLANLMHLAHLRGYSFTDALRRATEHFEADGME